MANNLEQKQQPEPADVSEAEIERFTPAGLIGSVVTAIGIALGLSLLWGLEAVRNGYFGLLDRWNVKARRRPASAFPPGRPRKRSAT